MNAVEERRIVDFVAKGLRHRDAGIDVPERLQSLGFSEEQSLQMIQIISHAIRSGINAEVTNGLSAKEYERGKLSLYDAAFDYGRREFRKQVRWVWIRRGLLGLLLVALVIFIVLMGRHLTNRFRASGP